LAKFTHRESVVENQNKVETAPAKRRVPVVRILVIVVIGAALAVLVYFSPRFFIKEEKAPTYPELKVGGTNSAFVIVENRWKGKYRDEKGVQIAFDSTGSTKGVTGLLDGTYAIAFTHGPLSPEQRQKAKEKGDVVQIPVLICGVAPVYHVAELKGKEPLKLTGELLGKIFLGEIKEWNDPALKLANPELAELLPPKKIIVVHREDSSGTTQLFTEYLHAASKEWRDKYDHPAAEIKWPEGMVAANRNVGVVIEVGHTDGAIGYVDRMFTTVDKIVLDYAAVQTKEDKKVFVRAEQENMAAAVNAVLADIPEDLAFDLANKPGKEAYPISGVIYAMCYQNQPGAQRQQVVDFLHWATHDGQSYAEKMTYAKLPPELVKRIDQRLEMIKATP
jgi:phosphate transport system substrate-binding protein